MNRNGPTMSRSRAAQPRMKVLVDEQLTSAVSTAAGAASRRNTLDVESALAGLKGSKVSAASAASAIPRGALNDVSHANNRLRGPAVPGKENKIISEKLHQQGASVVAVPTTGTSAINSTSTTSTTLTSTLTSNIPSARPRAATTSTTRTTVRPHSTSSAVGVTKIPSSRHPHRESAPVPPSSSTSSSLTRTASGRLRDEADEADPVSRKRPRIFPGASSRPTSSVVIPAVAPGSASASSVSTIPASDDEPQIVTSEADVEELAKVPEEVEGEFEEDEDEVTAVPQSVVSSQDTKTLVATTAATPEPPRSPSPDVEAVPLWWTEASPETEFRYATEIEAIRVSFKDEVDEWDPSMVSEYADEIFDYMGDLELKSMPNPNYMEMQNEIQWHQRTTLVDWLVQIHARYHLTPETLWIAVNIIDRFLSKRVVSLVKLQLVGVTAMFIAAKYEEIVAPSVDEFVFMTENGYTKEEILKGEKIILQSLGFHISAYCSPYSWVRKISKADDYDIQTRTLSKFLMEVCLLDHRFLCAKPSLIAAIAMYTSRRMLEGDWNEAFVFYSGFLEEQLEAGFEYLVETIAAAGFGGTHTYRKYASKRFLKSSVFARTWTKTRWSNGPVQREDDMAMDE